MVNIKPKLLYFNNWLKGHAVEILNKYSDIDLVKLNFADKHEISDNTLSTFTGYQIMPRTELDPHYLLNKALIYKMDNLLAVCSTGSGYDMIDVAACNEAGIIVCNQAGTNKEAVAEHVFGLILAISKKIIKANHDMRSIDLLGRQSLTGNDIFGKTLGIIGLGHIGTRVAKIAKAFSLNVISYDPYVDAKETRNRYATKSDWTTVLSESDFITVHCPRTKETLNMFGSTAFQKMKAEAIFINTARGGIHNEKDLENALSSNQISGAALDVWWDEPTPITNPLLKFDNVIASPHIAGVTNQAKANMGIQAAEQWKEIFKGKVPTRLVNPETWEKYSHRFQRTFGFTPDKIL